MTYHDDDGSPGRGDGISTGDGPSAATYTPPIHVIVLRQVADALETEPVDLPPLNSVIDPDALCVLARTTRWTDGDWPAIRFPYVDCLVTVTGPSSVRVDRLDPTKAAGRPATTRWPHAVPASDDGSGPAGTLESRLVTALADRSGHDAVEVREAVDDVVDRSAVARLNRRRANGLERVGATVRFAALGHDVVVRPDGTIAVGSTLERLRRTGSNVLLVGGVPDEIAAHASAQFLGQQGGPHRRLFALLDRGVDAAIDRLSLLGDPSGPAHVIDRGTMARSSAAAQDGPAGGEVVPGPDAIGDGVDSGAAGRDDPSGTDADVTVETADGDLEAFADAVEGAVEDDPDSAGAAELRLCVDSLRPLVEGRGADGALKLLEPICNRVAAASGIGHYVFPVDRDAAPVRALESLFDATVELRVGPAGPVQRWHLHDGNYATEWFALRRP